MKPFHSILIVFALILISCTQSEYKDLESKIPTYGSLEYNQWSQEYEYNNLRYSNQLIEAQAPVNVVYDSVLWEIAKVYNESYTWEQKDTLQKLAKQRYDNLCIGESAIDSITNGIIIYHVYQRRKDGGIYNSVLLVNPGNKFNDEINYDEFVAFIRIVPCEIKGRLINKDLDERPTERWPYLPEVQHSTFWHIGDFCIDFYNSMGFFGTLFIVIMILYVLVIVIGRLIIALGYDKLGIEKDEYFISLRKDFAKSLGCPESDICIAVFTGGNYKDFESFIRQNKVKFRKYGYHCYLIENKEAGLRLTNGPYAVRLYLSNGRAIGASHGKLRDHAPAKNINIGQILDDAADAYEETRAYKKSTTTTWFFWHD